MSDTHNSSNATSKFDSLVDEAKRDLAERDSKICNFSHTYDPIRWVVINSLCFLFAAIPLAIAANIQKDNPLLAYSMMGLLIIICIYIIQRATVTHWVVNAAISFLVGTLFFLVSVFLALSIIFLLIVFGS